VSDGGRPVCVAPRPARGRRCGALPERSARRGYPGVAAADSRACRPGRWRVVLCAKAEVRPEPRRWAVSSNTLLSTTFWGRPTSDPHERPVTNPGTLPRDGVARAAHDGAWVSMAGSRSAAAVVPRSLAGKDSTSRGGPRPPFGVARDDRSALSVAHVRWRRQLPGRVYEHWRPILLPSHVLVNATAGSPTRRSLRPRSPSRWTPGARGGFRPDRHRGQRRIGRFGHCTAPALASFGSVGVAPMVAPGKSFQLIRSDDGDYFQLYSTRTATLGRVTGDADRPPQARRRVLG